MLLKSAALVAAFCAAARGQDPVDPDADYTRFLPVSRAGGNCASPNQVDVGSLKECQDLCTALLNAPDGERCEGGVHYRYSVKKCVVQLSASRCIVDDFQFYSVENTKGRACGEVEYNLIWLLDESGSVSRDEFARMTMFANDVTASLSHHPEKTIKKAAMVEFSALVNGQSSQVTLNQVSSFGTFESLLIQATRRGGNTNIQDALEEGILVSREFGGRNIIILLTDGEPTVYNSGNGGVIRDDDEAARRAVEVARQIQTQGNNMEMVYGSIDQANLNLFRDVVPEPTKADISSWELNEFVEELDELIGDAVCKTDAPTSRPTSRPTSNSPTISPTKAPTISPTPFPTTLPPSLCTVEDSGERSVVYRNGDTDNMPASKFQVFNGAKVADDALWLTTEETLPSSSSFVFFRAPQNLVGGFVANFTVEIEDASKAQGFAFVMHRHAGGLENIPQSTGEGLGYGQITNRVAIAFDTCVNRNDGGSCAESFLDIKSSPIEGGSAPVFDGDSYIKPVPRADKKYTVQVKYLEQGEVLRAYASVDDSAMEQIIELWNFRIENVTGGVDAFLGFTTASGNDVTGIKITEWEVDTVPLVPENTEAIDLEPEAEPKTLVADGESTEGFSIALKDFCNNTVVYGGAGGDFHAVYVELIDALTGSYASKPDARRRLNAVGEGAINLDDPLKPTLVPAEILDLGDGTYTAALQTTFANVSFALYAAYGKGCDLSVEYVPVQGSDLFEGRVTLASENPDECFFSNVPKAIETVPPPPQPIEGPGESTIDDEGNETNVALIGAIGGGVAAFLLMSAIVMSRYRRKWQEDKGFIDEGRIYNLEKDVQYADDANLGALGGAVLSTRQAILREKSQLTKAGRPGEIATLQREKEELTEMVRQNKMNLQVDSESATLASSNPIFEGERKRREFGGGEV